RAGHHRRLDRHRDGRRAHGRLALRWCLARRRRGRRTRRWTRARRRVLRQARQPLAEPRIVHTEILARPRGHRFAYPGGATLTMHTAPQFLGKFRGVVTNNVDPKLLGRVQVSVPAVLGSGRLSWAMPCTPYAGPQVGLFLVPPIGANVWVEFEAGDPDYPILAGCFWGAGEVPASPAVPEIKVIKTQGVTLILSDLPGAGGFTLDVSSPAVPAQLKLVFSASGIELTNGSASVKLSPASVSLNNGALEVI